ncbi:MAG: hypothetical protein QM572_05515, partial [Nocardioides sp.]|uniref:hypothetical protein n=1 Tax=Nocardioides sp. TaxID=35761 RepID=UPI0039E6FA20
RRAGGRDGVTLRNGAARLAAVTLLLGLVLGTVVAAATPASAHSGTNVSQSLRSEITSVPEGLEAQVNSDGSTITVRAAVEVVVSASPDAAAFTIPGGSGWHPWHDDRVIWEGATLPQAVLDDPRHRHEVATWAIPVTVGGADAQITGRVVWEPPASAQGVTLWLLVGLVALVVGLAAWAAFPRRPHPRGR